MYTLGTASKATGVSKSTIYRAIKAGRVSATRTDTGDYAIDPAELHRVFAAVSADGTNGATRSVKRDATAADTAAAIERAGLAVEVRMLREQLADARRDREDARAERNAWRDHAQVSQRQLTDQRAPEKPLGWWRRLRNGKPSIAEIERDG